MREHLLFPANVCPELLQLHQQACNSEPCQTLAACSHYQTDQAKASSASSCQLSGTVIDWHSICIAFCHVDWQRWQCLKHMSRLQGKELKCGSRGLIHKPDDALRVSTSDNAMQSQSRRTVLPSMLLGGALSRLVPGLPARAQLLLHPLAERSALFPRRFGHSRGLQVSPGAPKVVSS